MGRHKAEYKEKKYLDAIEDYNKGMPISEIVAKYGISDTTFRKIRKVHKVPRRGSIVELQLSDKIPELVRLYNEECFTMRELAEEFGISVASVHSILLKSGGRSRKAAARYLFSRKLELDICRDYLDSRSAVDVGKKYEVSHVIVLEIARAYGIITSKRFRQACRRWRL